MVDFRTLDIWKRSHKIPLFIYKTSSNFPKSETFGITSQIRRASLSIPTNIAEGCGYNSKLQLKRFLTISMGSCSEVDYLLEVCKELNYLSEKESKKLQKEIAEIRKMIYSFSNKLK